MDCKVARKLFVNYKDGDLPKSKKEAFESHLAQCNTCREEWDDYQRTLLEITGMLDLLPPPDFVSKVKQTIGKRSKGRFFGDSGYPSVIFAVVSFILILLFLLTYIFITHSMEIHIAPSNEGELSSPTEDR